MLFKLLPGGCFSQTDANGEEVTYKPGDKVTSDRPLDTMFVNRFERLPDPVDAPPPPPASTPQGGGAVPLGEDVSDQFVGCEDAGVSVLQSKRTKRFFVVKPDALDKALHASPLKRAEVETFIATLGEQPVERAEE